MKEKDLSKLENLKDELEKSQRNKKKNIKNELIEAEAAAHMNEYQVKNEVPEVKEVKSPKTSKEDKLKIMLDEQHIRIEELIRTELNNLSFRLFCSFRAEFQKQLSKDKGIKNNG